MLQHGEVNGSNFEVAFLDRQLFCPSPFSLLIPKLTSQYVSPLAVDANRILRVRILEHVILVGRGRRMLRKAQWVSWRHSHGLFPLLRTSFSRSSSLHLSQPLHTKAESVTFRRLASFSLIPFLHSTHHGQHSGCGAGFGVQIDHRATYLS